MSFFLFTFFAYSTAKKIKHTRSVASTTIYLCSQKFLVQKPKHRYFSYICHIYLLCHLTVLLFFQPEQQSYDVI